MEEAIKLDSKYFLYYWNLARLLSITGNSKALKKVYEKARLNKRLTTLQKKNLEKYLGILLDLI